MTDDEDPRLVERAQSRVGTVLNGKWALDRLIGVGGMAVVYAATHRNKKRAAIKLLHPELSLRSDIRSRFLREGYVANSVEHPGAVQVHDDDAAEDGAAFLVMELLEGDSVEARRIRKGGTLPVSEVLAISERLLDVLVAAHDKGIIHRDLKPENLFLNHDGQLKVLDFGIARLREMKDTGSTTRTGSLMGTPSFMAPEQARGRWNDVDARTDLWAVGATMFTLLSSHFVHEAETANEALAMAITQPARAILSVSPDVHPAVAAVIDKALAYERDARFADAREMLAAVRQACAALSLPIDSAGRPMAVSLPDIGTGSMSASRLSATPVFGRSANVTSASALTVSAQAPARKRPALLMASGAAALALLGTIAVFLVSRGGDEAAAPRGETPSSSAASAVTLSPMEATETSPRSTEPAAPAPELPTADPTQADAAAATSQQEPAPAISQTPILPAKLRAPSRTAKPRDTVKPLAAPPPVTAAPTPDPFSRRR